jgi:hypothetical protein
LCNVTNQFDHKSISTCIPYWPTRTNIGDKLIAIRKDLWSLSYSSYSHKGVHGKSVLIFLGTGARALIWLIAIYAVATGIVMIMLALRLRAHRSRREPGTAYCVGYRTHAMKVVLPKQGEGRPAVTAAYSGGSAGFAVGAQASSSAAVFKIEAPPTAGPHPDGSTWGWGVVGVIDPYANANKTSSVSNSGFQVGLKKGWG